MEVILKEDVNNLGHRGDVVKVADGYGRNYLLPQKLALEATAANKVVIEQMKSSAVRRSAKEKSEAEQLLTQLNDVALVFTRKVGENMIAGQPTGQGSGSVVSGALEGSGADPARAMVDMIASMRAFEAGQKVIQAIDDTLGQAASKVGTVS